MDITAEDVIREFTNRTPMKLTSDQWDEVILSESQKVLNAGVNMAQSAHTLSEAMLRLKLYYVILLIRGKPFERLKAEFLPLDEIVKIANDPELCATKPMVTQSIIFSTEIHVERWNDFESLIHDLAQIQYVEMIKLASEA